MAMQEGDGAHPYFAMVGNFGKPSWADTAVAYSAFYHRISKGHYFVDAVAAMKAASGDENWVIETAEESRRSYIDYLSTAVLDDARRALELVASNNSLPVGAKALENPIGSQNKPA